VVPPLVFVLAGILFNEIVYFLVLALITAALPIFLSPRKLWRATPGIQDDRKYVFTDEGFSMRCALADTRLSWIARLKSREFGRHYSIRGINGGVLTIVPKRAFSSTEDEAAFRALLRAHTQAQLKSRSNSK
jgi:hypothetical protein